MVELKRLNEALDEINKNGFTDKAISMADKLANMTINELVKQYYIHNPDGHYFDKETLKYFGERLSNMRVLKGTYMAKDYLGNEIPCYKISKISKDFKGDRVRNYAYFSKDNFDFIVSATEE